MSADPSPYAPPDAAVDLPPGARQGSVAKALLYGLLCYWGSAITLGVLWFFVYADLAGVDPLGATAEHQLAASTPYLLSTLAFDSVFLALGGYIAARVANRPGLRVGYYFAALTLALGLLFLPLMSSYPTWFVLLSYAIGPPIAVAGAWLWRPPQRS